MNCIFSVVVVVVVEFAVLERWLIDSKQREESVVVSEGERKRASGLKRSVSFEVTISKNLCVGRTAQ